LPYYMMYVFTMQYKDVGLPMEPQWIIAFRLKASLPSLILFAGAGGRGRRLVA